MTSVGAHVFGGAFTKLKRSTGWKTPALDFLPMLLEQNPLLGQELESSRETERKIYFAQQDQLTSSKRKNWELLLRAASRVQSKISTGGCLAHGLTSHTFQGCP